MAETKDGSYFLALQYAFNELKILEEEVKLMEGIIIAMYGLEKAKMLVVRSEEHTALFQAYKGAFQKFNQFKKKEKKRNLINPA